MKLRAPAYPLINVDPYFTIWSMADRLHDVPVKHWTGSDNTLIGICSVAMVITGELLARPFSLIFVGYDENLLALTLRGFTIFSLSFLFSGLAIYGSGFFTALNNGLVSAIISFLRTLVFQIAAVLLLPLIWGIDGVWLSVVVAELAAAALTVAFLAGMRKKYGY